ncbi:hypothetical protein [Tenacibaculum agarivorans]|uniref:hypothetical protein n=1 Tax=Tenacibaculum agarivorans TaxID=1908389 RepID=UPI00094B9E4F|nr:hypothetical protein [Tenacibaculum agarivorans]
MDRKTFLKLGTSALALHLVPSPVKALSSVNNKKTLKLPFIDGIKEVTVLDDLHIEDEYNDDQMHHHYIDQQYLHYKIAINQYRRMLRQMRSHYLWLQQQELRAMYQFARSYNYCILMTDPFAIPSVKSVYTCALQDHYSKPIVFGLNRYKQKVITQHTTKAQSNLYNKLNNIIGTKRAEQAIAPQTSEVTAKIILPKGQGAAKGMLYETQNGYVASSFASNFRSQDGKVGELVKYKIGNDGEKYAIV